MIEQIKETEIEFMELFSDPTAMTECLIPENINSPQIWPNCNCITLRNYQFAMQNYSYLIADDNALSKKENLNLKQMTGNLYSIGARNLGKCNSINDEIFLADGSLKTLGSLIGTLQNVISFNDKTLKLETDRASFRDNGEKPCYRIKLASGKELTVTENHPLYTASGWICSENLFVGQYIATPRKIDIDGVDVDDNIAILLGYFLGDGSCTSTQMAITNINQELIDEFYVLAEHFDCRVSNYRMSYGFARKAGYKGKNKIIELCDDYDLRKPSKIKTIHSDIFKWSNKPIALLLNRLFACDGHIRMSKEVHIELTLASKKMVYQIQTLLLRFGIHSDIHYKKSKCNEKYFDAWRLNIGLDADKFLDKIGIKSKDFGQRNNKSYSTSDRIPNDYILKYYNEFSKKKELRLRNLKPYSPSRGKCQRIAKLINHEELSKIANSDIYWEKIIELEFVGMKPTVMVSVDKNHTYISNNIISHNSLWLWIDTILTVVDKVKEACVASFDDQHLKKVTNTISLFVESHKFLRIFHLNKETSRSKTVKRSPFEIVTEHGSVVKGINEKVEGDNPGTAFHGLHFDYLNYEEFCVDGKTQIRWVDTDGNVHSDRIVRFIDSGDWKNAKVYSYNFKNQKIELKKVVDIFQKNVKHYGVWDLKFETFGNTKYRSLITSQHQKIWTDSGYKEVEDISKNDTFYTFDYYKLTDVQKQITIGTLLGDACVSQKVKGKCLPSMHFVQGMSQEDYIQYKKQCFSNLFQSFHRQKNKTGFNYQETSWGGKTLHGTTDTSVDFNEFLHFKKSGKDKKTLDVRLLEKYLSEISLAFWVMDDGLLLGNKGKTEKTKYIRLNTQGFNHQSHLLLQEVLKNKFCLDVEIRKENRFGKQYFVLQFDNKNTLKLIDKIKQYIHPTFYYKIYTKIELCDLIYKNIKPEFTDLSLDVKDLLQPIKLLSKDFVIRRTWKMHDIEVADNHNFFAGGTLISNSYASDVGAKKRVDSGNSLGYIERLSGIPDLCIGSPMGKVLKNPKNKSWIWRLPQFVREDYSQEMHEKLAEEHGGEKSASFKLNVEAITLEGAYGFWDMARLKEASFRKNKSIKSFEIGKDNFQDFKSLIHVERLSGSEQVFIMADIGFNAAPTEIIIVFFDGKKYTYSYNITLYRLVRKEQAEVFYWLYKKLHGGFIGIDATSDDGVILDYVYDMGVPKSDLIKVKFNANVEIGFQKDDDDNIILDKSGVPLMQTENARQFAFQELEKIMYGGNMIVPFDEKLLNQLTSTIAKQTKGMKMMYENKSSADHLHSAFEVFAVCRFLKEFEQVRGMIQHKRAFCS